MKNLLIQLVGFVWFLMVITYWTCRLSLKIVRALFWSIEVCARFVRKACTRGLINLLFWRRRKDKSIASKTEEIKSREVKPKKSLFRRFIKSEEETKNAYTTTSGKEVKIEIA